MEAHEKLFHLLTKNWRENWAEELPFYYVQLSSIDRPSWPWFRDSQRRMLQSIPNSGMAVSSDHGDSLDVHPQPQTGDRGTPRSLGTQQDIRARDPSFRSTLPIGDIQGQHCLCHIRLRKRHAQFRRRQTTYFRDSRTRWFIRPRGGTNHRWKDSKSMERPNPESEIRPLRLATFHPCQFSERSGVAGFDIPFGSGSGQLVSAA